MIVAEEVFLLLQDEHGTIEIGPEAFECAVAAGGLFDLMLAARISLSPEPDPKILVADVTPINHPVLDAMLDRARRYHDKPVSRLFSGLRSNTRLATGGHLARQGLVHQDSSLWAGTRFLELDPRPENSVRGRLAHVIQSGAAPSPPDVAVLAVLHGFQITSRILEWELSGIHPGQAMLRVGAIVSGFAPPEVLFTAMTARQTATDLRAKRKQTEAANRSRAQNRDREKDQGPRGSSRNRPNL